MRSLRVLAATFTSLLLASSALAVDVCGYSVRLKSWGFLCPYNSAPSACVSVSANTGSCDVPLHCVGGTGFFCDLTLTPQSGPEAQCPFGSRRLTGLRCFPQVTSRTNTPTPPPIVLGTPTATSTPVEAATGTATSSATSEPTLPPTATASGTPPASATPTSTPMATETATSTPPAPTDTPTSTPPSTATASGAAATGTTTPPSTGTPTATPPSTATASATGAATGTMTPPSTGTATATAPSTATATATASATRTGTVTPPSTHTPTGTPPSTATASATHTNTALPPPATSTATPTPTTGSATCGNGFLDPGETCESCPGDCVVQPCPSVTPTVSFAVDLIPPAGQQPTAATVLLGYDSGLVSIPGTGNELSVRQRVLPPAPLPQSFSVNDLDYAVRVVLTRNTPLGFLFTARFDRCQAAPAPTVADFGCAVEGCAGGAGPIEGCTCTVRVP